MKPKKIVYVEPADYFPEDVRRECKLGEFAERDDSNKNDKTSEKDQKNEE